MILGVNCEKEKLDIRTLERIHKLGVCYIFLVFPKINKQIKKFVRTVQFIHDENMKVMVDIDRNGISVIMNNQVILQTIQALKIDCLRLDDILEIEEAKRVVSILEIEELAINPSVMNPQEYSGWKNCHQKVIAVHNFYPSAETGLGLSQISSMNQVLKEEDIPAFIFIGLEETGPCLTTLEDLRGKNVSAVCKWLTTHGIFLDGIIISGLPIDTLESEAGFREISCLKQGASRIFGGYIFPDHEAQLVVIAATSDEITKEILFSQKHILRPDSSEICYRSLTSRQINSEVGREIVPENCIARPAGTITIENSLAGKYSGEIRILKKDMPAISTSNVIGYSDLQNRNGLKSVIFKETSK